MPRFSPMLCLFGAIVTLAGCAPMAPRQDIQWSGPPPASASVACRNSERMAQQPASRYGRRVRSGTGSDEYECRRLMAEEQRRRTAAEREQQDDQRRLKGAAQSQAQSSCTNAIGDLTLCRNLATLGSIILP